MKLAGLWRNPDFVKFWVGQTISFFGSEITSLALPLTAVLLLNATPAEMGLLVAARNLPFLLVGLLAGVWVDRVRRRPLLVASDLCNAVLLGSIPVAALFGWLSMWHLYVVSFLVGLVFVVSMVAYQSFLPSLVQRQNLVEGNSKLEVSGSVAGIAGPGLAGILVQLVTAPLAILVDAGSFLVSALFLSAVRAQEPAPIPHGERRNVLGQIKEGLHLVLYNPLLRSLVSCGATHNFCSRMMDALYVLYLTQELKIEPALLGFIVALGGPGALVGALISNRAPRWLGLGPTIVGAQVLTGIARLFVPLAGGPFPLTVALLMAAEFLLGVARPIFNVNQVSLRQAITPDRLQGRVNATMRFIMWSVTPVGALLGGMLASTLIGIRVTMLMAATGVLLAFLWVYFSPLRALRQQPQLEEEAAAAHPG